MSLASQFADNATVRTHLGEREFVEIYAEVQDGVLVISRDNCPLAWFAAGTWQVSFL